MFNCAASRSEARKLNRTSVTEKVGATDGSVSSSTLGGSLVFPVGLCTTKFQVELDLGCRLNGDTKAAVHISHSEYALASEHCLPE